MNKGLRQIRKLSVRAVLFFALCLFVVLTIAGLLMTAHLGKQSWSHEAVVFAFDGPVVNLLLAGVLLLAMTLVHWAAERFALIRFSAASLCLWGAAALVLVIGANVRQMYDFAYVLEGAELFAGGNYKPLQIDYFNVYSYQLGICLPMEILKRLLPGVNLGLLMQSINVILSVLTAGMLTALSQVFFSERQAKAAVVLQVGFLPMALYCIFVYGTLPMLFCVSSALLCLALYFRRRQACFGLLYALLMAAGYVLKPNAAVPLIAATVCIVLDVLVSRDWKLLGFAALSVLLSVGLLRLVILQYEVRGGVKLTGDVSMLARLVMGLQEGGAEAGWFNRYTEQFFPFGVTDEQEFAIASADLAARLAQMKADPRMAAAFFRDKMFSQWLEPSYSTMWYGDLCAHAGALGDATKAIFADGGALRAALERYMGAYQKLLFVLSCAGLADRLGKRDDAMNMALPALPLSALGGWMYHMIFEAKSQYLYMYAMLMMPLAAQGLVLIGQSVRSFMHRGNQEKIS